MTVINPSIVARFAADLDRLIEPGARLGVAVSGGPDSLALLLLAAASRPELVEAATVDHGLRAEARAEAERVAALCRTLNVPHSILPADWDEPPATAIQERARTVRYGRLGDWMGERGLDGICTAHHQGDQAETLMMRLARGSGLRGLSGIRPIAPLPGHQNLRLFRPLLSWSRAELQSVCDAAGVAPADDPSNRDEAHERVRVRRWIGKSGIEPSGPATSAGHLQGADDAIEWAVDREWRERVSEKEGDGFDYRPDDAPAEIRRRIVARAIAALETEGDRHLRGRELDRMLDTLGSGGVATLRGVRCEGGATWRFRSAPGRVWSKGKLG